MMKGGLSVDSAPGEGTTICLSLPLRLPLAPQGEMPDDSITKGPAHRLRILLAEDDEVNLVSGRNMLEKLGHTVTTAMNGQEALDLLQRQQFDLVFMDIQMPILDGVEATRALRQGKGPQANIPVIAMTAYAMTGDREIFLQAGMNDYLAKPVSRQALIQVIERTMSAGS
jgi:two-component system, sensor histidine kinase